MTKAQEQVLATLRAQGFTTHTFSAHDAFPGTMPQDNANRRVLESLVREGILAHGVAPRGQALSPVASQAVVDMQTSRERIEQANVRIDMATGREARQALEGWFQTKGIDPRAGYNVSKAREIADEALQAKIITPEVHQQYMKESIQVLQDEPVTVQMIQLTMLHEKGSQRSDKGLAARPQTEKSLYHFAAQRERETSLGHKAEQHRGQEMGL